MDGIGFDSLRIKPSELDALSDSQKQFLVNAHNGGMEYWVNNDGCVCASGVAYKCVFDVNVKVERNDGVGVLVTLDE